MNSPVVHILNGDALYKKWPDDFIGDVIIMRECLVDGPVKSTSIENFWAVRQDYLQSYDDTIEYYNYSVPELQKILKLNENSSVYLWFEYDLFCQVNMWWICYQLIKQEVHDVSWVSPPKYDWKGFGSLHMSDVYTIYDKAEQIDSFLLAKFSKLWEAYESDNIDAFQKIREDFTGNLKILSEVIEVQLNRYNPAKSPISNLKSYKEKGIVSFGQAFRRFSSEYGIYGFGDLQIKRLWDNLDE